MSLIQNSCPAHYPNFCTCFIVLPKIYQLCVLLGFPSILFFIPQNFWLIVVTLAFSLTLIPVLWKEEFWLMKTLSKLGTWDSSESVMPHKGLQGGPSSKRSGGPRRRPATETSLPLRCRDTAAELHWALWARKAVYLPFQWPFVLFQK